MYAGVEQRSSNSLKPKPIGSVARNHNPDTRYHNPDVEVWLLLLHNYSITSKFI